MITLTCMRWVKSASSRGHSSSVICLLLMKKKRRNQKFIIKIIIFWNENKLKKKKLTNRKLQTGKKKQRKELERTIREFKEKGFLKETKNKTLDFNSIYSYVFSFVTTWYVSIRLDHFFSVVNIRFSGTRRMVVAVFLLLYISAFLVDFKCKRRLKLFENSNKINFLVK